MKKITFLLMVIAITITQISAKKIALIIGISKYSYSESIPEINTEKDVELIKQTLLNQGFLDENILILQNEATSRKKIVNAFKTHLIEKAEPGDIAFFHFSGHGQQVMDDNGDEADG